MSVRRANARGALCAVVLFVAVIAFPAAGRATAHLGADQLSPRYTGRGWAGVVQAGAATLTCAPDPAPPTSPPVGGPVVGGPSVGGPSVGGPSVGGPVVGGPVGGRSPGARSARSLSPALPAQPASGPLPQPLLARVAAPGCLAGADPGAPTAWVDTDPDPATVNSSRAVLLVPPGATIDWAGLYWAGDLGARPDPAPPRCDAAADTTPPATPPPAPSSNNHVRVSVGGLAYQAVTATSLSPISGPGGGSAYQAFADITALMRPFANRPDPTRVGLVVADVQVAYGPGCAGGWVVVLAYSYPGGPNPTYAPDYQSVAVFDGVLAIPAHTAQTSQLGGLVSPGAGPVRTRVTSAVLTDPGAISDSGLTVGGQPVPPDPTAVTGPGYWVAGGPLPPDTVSAGAASVDVSLTTDHDSYAATVITVTTVLPVTAALGLTSSFAPALVAVGSIVQLTVTVTNNADLPDSGLTVAVPLPPGLGVLRSTGNYDAATGLWLIGRLAAKASMTLVLDVQLQQAGTYTTQARVAGSDEPLDEATTAAISLARIEVATLPGAASRPPTEIAVAPAAASHWTFPRLANGVLLGLGLFAIGLLSLVVIVIRRRAA